MVKKFNIKKLFLRTFLIAFFGLFIFISILKSLPAPDVSIQTLITFYDINGEPFLEQTLPDRRSWVRIDEVSPYVINGFIATEDRHFKEHFGFDLPRIGRSLFVNLSTGTRSQGASTITQQYARNLFLSFERTWERKIKEAFHTVRLEAAYDKETILEGYLNTINFGHGNYGIEDAARFYFGKSANELALAEAAILVGIPKGPSIYSPITNLENATSRQSIVLHSMLRDGFITEAELQEAKTASLNVIGEVTATQSKTSYFVDSVLTELDAILEGNTLNHNHLRVHTTLDPDIQAHVNEAIKLTVVDQDVQTAIIVLHPQTGNVLALSGGNDYQTTQYNRALYSKRQVGSIMKPILYMAALEYGFTPSSTFLSQPTTFIYSDGNREYAPNNFACQYPYDKISMANAIAVSDNIYAVKTHTFLGMSVLPEMAQRLGITAEIPEIPSAPLGVTSICAMEMTEAYGVFANNGKAVNHRFIKQIYEGNRLLIDHTEAGVNKSEQLLNPTLTFIFNEMMTGMFEISHNHHLAVTGLSIIPDLTHRYAGKSGTTDTDSWMIGYTPELVTTVWTGYDEGRTLDGIEINRYAQTIWAHIMENSLAEDAPWFEAPDDVIPVSIDPLSGVPASKDTQRKITLYFEEGNLP